MPSETRISALFRVTTFYYRIFASKILFRAVMTKKAIINIEVKKVILSKE